MSYSATPILVRLPVWRARFVIVLFLLGFVAVAGRSGYLQAIRTAFLKEEGEARYARVIDVAATRGRILDRNGEALAISTPVKSVWAMPEELEADRRQRAVDRLHDPEVPAAGAPDGLEVALVGARRGAGHRRHRAHS